MLVLNERANRATSFEILASPDPAVPHRVLDQFTNLALSPSRFSVRRVNASTASIQIVFDDLDAERARRICGRIRRIVGVKSVELLLAISAAPEALRKKEDPDPGLRRGDAMLAIADVSPPPDDALLENGAEVLLSALADLGVDTIFGYPGGAALPIYDALFKQQRIRHILVRHEQAAAHAAEGYARSSGRVGVVLVTSGPGLTNTITGLMDALMDSIPVLCISGQVSSRFLGTDAFQEAPAAALTRPCTKYNRLIDRVEDVAEAARAGYRIARSGRPGPVVLDIPKDVQLAKLRVGAAEAPDAVSVSIHAAAADPGLLAEAAHAIANARRPILYVGGGVVNSGPEASRLLREFAHLCGAPVTSTLMGLGAFPASNPCWLGMLGMHGTYEANLGMRHCDVMVAIGARFDDRVTGRLDGFSPESVKIHIDVDASSIGKTVPAQIGIVADAREALAGLIAAWRALAPGRPQIGDWWRRIDAWRGRRCLAFEPSSDEILPQHAIRRLWELSRERDPIITTEVGQHQMWAAQHFGFEQPNRWLTSGGLGTMGYGLPAAIGAQIAHPGALVIDIAGEASIQMNIQELATAVQHRLPVKVFIVNNRYMGMVRQWQEMIHGGRYSESYSATLPDFVMLAQAYGARGLRCSRPEDLDGVITEMISTPGPVVVDCEVAQLANCFPMIPAGAAHDEMVLEQPGNPGNYQ
jgi:acetolactate synthase I/II/III large subunit